MDEQINAAARTRTRWYTGHVPLSGDERLARLAADGSERAFVALYERYHDRLYRYCRWIVKNDADAQDALQSTLTRAFAALQRGQRNGPLRPWLFRIAHNESVSVLRCRRSEAQLSELSTYSTGSTEEHYEQRERLALLVTDLQNLPERQRGALVMRELDGLSHEQIAIALGTSVGAVKQTIFEARRSLLEFAKGRKMACADLQRTISDADGRVWRSRRVRAHLRDCAGCAAFAAAIPTRRRALEAITPPPLPTLAGSGLLARVLASGTNHTGAATNIGASSGASGALAADVAGTTTSAVLAAKALASVAIVGGAAIGAMPPHTTHESTPRAPTTAIGATAHGTPPTSGALAARTLAHRALSGAGALPSDSPVVRSPAGSAHRASAADSSPTNSPSTTNARRRANGSTVYETPPSRSARHSGGPVRSHRGGAAPQRGPRPTRLPKAPGNGGPRHPHGPAPSSPGGTARQHASRPTGSPKARDDGGPQHPADASPSSGGSATSQRAFPPTGSAGASDSGSSQRPSGASPPNPGSATPQRASPPTDSRGAPGSRGS